MDRVPVQPIKDPPNLVRAQSFSLDRLLSHVDPGPAEESEVFVHRIYEQRYAAPPPATTARLVVDTDVASFIFKWHSRLAAPYVEIVRGSELVLSFMRLDEMRQGALDASWRPRKSHVLEASLSDFSVLHSDSLLCSTWAAVRNESARKGRRISSAD